MTQKKAESQTLCIVWVQLCIEDNTHIPKNRKEIYQKVNSGYFWVVQLHLIFFLVLISSFQIIFDMSIVRNFPPAPKSIHVAWEFRLSAMRCAIVCSQLPPAQGHFRAIQPLVSLYVVLSPCRHGLWADPCSGQGWHWRDKPPGPLTSHSCPHPGWCGWSIFSSENKTWMPWVLHRKCHFSRKWHFFYWTKTVCEPFTESSSLAFKDFLSAQPRSH